MRNPHSAAPLASENTHAPSRLESSIASALSGAACGEPMNTGTTTTVVDVALALSSSMCRNNSAQFRQHKHNHKHHCSSGHHHRSHNHQPVKVETSGELFAGVDIVRPISDVAAPASGIYGEPRGASSGLIGPLGTSEKPGQPNFKLSRGDGYFLQDKEMNEAYTTSQRPPLRPVAQRNAQMPAISSKSTTHISQGPFPTFISPSLSPALTPTPSPNCSPKEEIRIPLLSSPYLPPILSRMQATAPALQKTVHVNCSSALERVQLDVPVTSCTTVREFSGVAQSLLANKLAHSLPDIKGFAPQPGLILDATRDRSKGYNKYLDSPILHYIEDNSFLELVSYPEFSEEKPYSMMRNSMDNRYLATTSLEEKCLEAMSPLESRCEEQPTSTPLQFQQPEREVLQPLCLKPNPGHQAHCSPKLSSSYPTKSDQCQNSAERPQSTLGVDANINMLAPSPVQIPIQTPIPIPATSLTPLPCTSEPSTGLCHKTPHPKKNHEQKCVKHGNKHAPHEGNRYKENEEKADTERNSRNTTSCGPDHTHLDNLSQRDCTDSDDTATEPEQPSPKKMRFQPVFEYSMMDIAESTRKTAQNTSCHRCKTRKPQCLVCPMNEKHKFCVVCLERHHNTLVIPNTGCPLCTQSCTCAMCRKKF
ncbi:hypothetical protein Pelo_16362 [Pelomyxa schiedti]|nr:hypothetical protein Pelo_16362 [Pelomyxa schiedti]